MPRPTKAIVESGLGKDHSRWLQSCAAKVPWRRAEFADYSVSCSMQPRREIFMKRVTGIGGIFFKSDNPEELYQWYEKHLGIKREAHGQGAMFPWQEPQDAEND